MAFERAKKKKREKSRRKDKANIVIRLSVIKVFVINQRNTVTGEKQVPQT